MRYPIIALLICMMECLGADSLSAEVQVPQKYVLSDVTIEIVSRSDWGAGTTTITIHGSGLVKCDYFAGTDGARRFELRLSKWEVSHLLHRLYVIRFFDLANDYTGGYPSVYLDGDTLRQCGGSAIDLGYTSVECRIGRFRKRVATDQETPGDLWAFSNDVFEQMAKSMGIDPMFPLRK